MEFETLAFSVEDRVARLSLSRAAQANALDAAMWRDLERAFTALEAGPARVAIVSGEGGHFCAGIDFAFLQTVRAEIAALPAAEREPALAERIRWLQAATGAAARCAVPVIAAIHGACIGAGVDLIAACDLRYATRDARFSVKEVDLAIVADLGSLQRLPRLIGEGRTRELAYTGREFDGEEACAIGLVTAVFDDREALMRHVAQLATTIAAKSPRTLRGIKASLAFGGEHTVAEGLEEIARRNASALFSADLDEAIAAARERRPPRFAD